MKRLFLMLLAAITLAACDKGGDDTPKNITITGGDTNQTIYADETEKSEGIKFNATADWTAQVSEVTKADDEKMWFRLSAYEGKAGDITLGFEIDANDTGKDRKAEIRISCGGTTITITVEQKGVTQSGEKPESTARYITAAGKITGGEIFGKNTPTTLRWAMRSTNGGQEVLSPTSFPYVNKNFDITLPIPAENLLGAITDYSGLSIIPSSAKFTSAVLYDQHTVLELTNITFENATNGNYRLKKGEGSVFFMYATTASTVSGMFTNDDGDCLRTIKFNNCQFRQGWNEMMMVAEADASVNGYVTYSVTTNNATSDFKWVVQSGEKPEPVIISRLKIDEGTEIRDSEQLYYHSWIKMRYEWSDKRVEDVVHQARIGTDVQFDTSDLGGKLITSPELNFTDPTLIDIIQEDRVGDSEYVGIKINTKKYAVSCNAFAIRFYVTEPIPYYDDGIVTYEMPAYVYDKDSFKFLYNIEEMGDDIVDGQPVQAYTLCISLTWSINGKEYHSRKEFISLYKYK